MTKKIGHVESGGSNEHKRHLFEGFNSAHIKCFSSKIYFLIFKILIYLIYLFSNKKDAKYVDIDITGNMVEHF